VLGLSEPGQSFSAAIQAGAPLPDDRLFYILKRTPMAKLQGKVAVITGGGSGQGLATAKRFVEEGAFVYIAGRRQAELDNAVSLIGRNVAAVQADVSNLADLDRLYAKVAKEKGKIPAALVNKLPALPDRPSSRRARGQNRSTQSLHSRKRCSRRRSAHAARDSRLNPNVSCSTSNGSQSIRRSAARSPCPRAANDMLDTC
jgi:short chain dehydrogenase